MAVLTVEQNDRLPLIPLKAPVDSSRFRFDLRIKVVLALEVAAAGRANLNERELSLVPGIVVEKTLHRQKAVEDALGLVHALHAHGQEVGVHMQAPQSCRRGVAL